MNYDGSTPAVEETVDQNRSTSSEPTSYFGEQTKLVRAIRTARPEEFTRSEANQCFGDCTEEAFGLLVDDIKRQGQLYPILTWRELILDGFKRCRACQVLNIPVLICEVLNPDDVPSVEELARITLSSQFSRESFTKIQKAAYIRDIFDAVICKGRPRKGSETDPLLSDIAKEYSVPKTYLKLVGMAKRQHLEMFEKIKAGKISYSKLEAEFNDKKRQKGKKDHVIEGQYMVIKNDTYTDLTVPPRSRVNVGSEAEATVFTQSQEEDKDQWDTPTNPSGDAASSMKPVAPATRSDTETLAFQEAKEKLVKAFNTILGYLSSEEKPVFKELVVEPAYDFLEINLN